MSPSPLNSPVMGASYKGVDRHHTNSPPLQVSKRDKRRNMLAERLDDLTKQFSQNRDVHYREQLQAIQIDMNLIMEADAHGEEPLKNQPDEIDTLVLENIKTVSRKPLGLAPPPRAGRIYSDFAKEVNDSMEERDATLTANRRDFTVKLSETAAAHAYRKKLAASEHKDLASTLRDRLINSVTNKRTRLSRDKETNEIGDSNALLLHPSQFGLANPASPSGLHGKRSTRNRRDAEDLANLVEGNKRKRKAADSDESPAPTRQRLDNGSITPLWFIEKKEMHFHQVESALYSIDKLFTEKELAMTYNAAALAAHSYMQRHQPYTDDLESPPNGKSDSSADGRGTVDPDADDADSPPGGIGMERQFSHATRSTRAVAPNYVTGLGIDMISDLNFPGSMEALNKQIPKLPPLLINVMQKAYVKGEAANQPAGLSFDEAAAEYELIKTARQYNDYYGYGKNLELDNGGKKLLEAVTTPRKYDYYTKSDNIQALQEMSLRGGPGKEKEETLLGMGSFGGESMSRVPSDIGMGGIAMSRQNTGEGRTSMRGRTIKPTSVP